MKSSIAGKKKKKETKDIGVRDGERESSERVPGAVESHSKIIRRRHFDAERICGGGTEEVRGK